MLIAMVLVFSFLGRRIQQLAAVLGGIGFGVFIDELGKIITKDNNYFFEPTVGILYAVFVVLYLTFNFLGRRQQMSSREYMLNALAQLEDAVAQDMDVAERARVLDLLARARRGPRAGASGQAQALAARLHAYVRQLEPLPAPQPSRVQHLKRQVDKQYRRFWHARRSNRLVQVFFIAEVIVFLAAIAYSAFNGVDQAANALFGGRPTYAALLLPGEFAAALVAAAFAAVGAYKLRVSRTEAFEWFRRATLVNLLLTEFFVFSRVQFEALPGFGLHLALLWLINFVLGQERRLASTA